MSGGNIVTRLLDRVEIAGGTNLDQFRLEGQWRYSQAKLDEFVAAGGEIVISKTPFRPNYISRADKAKKCKNLLTIAGHGMATYEDATAEVRELFGRNVMDYPKPTQLVRFLVEAITLPGDLVMDFFAGSGTTGHAVIQSNRESGGRRRFLLVQSPEPTQDPEFPTIAEICKERVRRVLLRHGQTNDGQTDPGGETPRPGVRVFRLVANTVKARDSQEAAADDDTPVGSGQRLADRLRQETTDEDSLFQRILEAGLPLTAKIEA